MLPGRVSRENRNGPANAEPCVLLNDQTDQAATYSPSPVTEQVPSAQEGLTAVFGMGTGVSPPPFAAWNLLIHCAPASEQGVCHISIRPISTTRLNTLLCVHLWPINLLVSEGPNVET